MWQTVLIIACCAAAITGIVILKTASDERSTAMIAARNYLHQKKNSKTDSLLNVAVPDTIGDASALPFVPDTIPPALPDSIGKDIRPVENAGEEDGYIAGYDDGILDRRNHRFDDSSTFKSAAERNAYAKGYAKGYNNGFAEAKEKQRLDKAEAERH